MKHSLPVIANSRSGHNFVINNILSWFEESPKVIDLENKLPSDYNKIMESNLFNHYDINCILVTRDLMNWLASSIKLIDNRNELSSNGSQKAIHLLVYRCSVWMGIMKESYGDTQFILNKIHVDYERFVYDADYRNIRCEAMGGTYNENMLRAIPHKGNGSSFDKHTVPAEKMDITRRYLEIPTDERYERVFRNVLKLVPEVVAYYKFKSNITIDQLAYLNNLGV